MPSFEASSSALYITMASIGLYLTEPDRLLEI